MEGLWHKHEGAKGEDTQKDDIAEVRRVDMPLMQPRWPRRWSLQMMVATIIAYKCVCRDKGTKMMHTMGLMARILFVEILCFSKRTNYRICITSRMLWMVAELNESLSMVRHCRCSVELHLSQLEYFSKCDRYAACLPANWRTVSAVTFYLHFEAMLRWASHLLLLQFVFKKEKPRCNGSDGQNQRKCSAASLKTCSSLRTPVPWCTKRKISPWKVIQFRATTMAPKSMWICQ